MIVVMIGNTTRVVFRRFLLSDSGQICMICNVLICNVYVYLHRSALGGGDAASVVLNPSYSIPPLSNDSTPRLGGTECIIPADADYDDNGDVISSLYTPSSLINAPRQLMITYISILCMRNINTEKTLTAP